MLLYWSIIRQKRATFEFCMLISIHRLSNENDKILLMRNSEGSLSIEVYEYQQKQETACCFRGCKICQEDLYWLGMKGFSLWKYRFFQVPLTHKHVKPLIDTSVETQNNSNNYHLKHLIGMSCFCFRLHTFCLVMKCSTTGLMHFRLL